MSVIAHLPRAAQFAKGVPQILAAISHEPGTGNFRVHPGVEHVINEQVGGGGADDQCVIRLLQRRSASQPGIRAGGV
jgi:hypothetical protein